MNRIPIYDATAPIAGTIGTDEIPDRIELVERIGTNPTTIERTPDGLLLHLLSTPANRADLERFAIDEMGGSSRRPQLLDRLDRYFIGIEPLTDIAGLLSRRDAHPYRPARTGEGSASKRRRRTTSSP